MVDAGPIAGTHFGALVMGVFGKRPLALLDRQSVPGIVSHVTLLVSYK